MERCGAGRRDEAAARLAEGLAGDSGGDTPQDWALLSLARGDPGEAPRWADRPKDRSPSNGPAAFWEESEIALLRREADAAVDPRGPLPDDAFARRVRPSVAWGKGAPSGRADCKG